VNDEQALVIALSLTSTLAAGLAVDRRGGATSMRPAAIALLLVAGGVGLPLAAFALDRALVLGTAGVGMLVASAATGGSTGPLLAVVAGGDARTAARFFVASTIFGTLTAIAAIVMLDAFDPRLVGRAAVLVTAVSLAPLALGVGVRRRAPDLARRLAPMTARLGVVLLAATVVVLLVRHGHEADPVDLLVATALVGASLALALFVRGRAERIAVAQVSAIHNLALALLVLSALEAPARASVAVLAYGLVMYVATAAIAIFARTGAMR
jgi:BASS family bile acid:Na+ symporter